MIQAHQIKRPFFAKKEKRIGRGGKRGTYSGRGIKGQKARAGRRLQPLIRQIIKRYPKLRGYKFKGKKRKVYIVNLSDLERKLKDNSEISPKILLRLGLVEKRGGRIPEIKILGRGEIKKKIKVKGLLVSEKAREKIEKAGGKVIK